jgi:predicted porin
MKKLKLILALGAALAGSVSAQTSIVSPAQPSATIYGIVDAGITYDRGSGAAGSVIRMDSGIQSGNRLGFRGTEDLGGGLTALFLLENGFTITNGAFAQGGLLFGRQAYVGLGNRYGQLRLGRQYTPGYVALRDLIDPMADGFAGAGNRLMLTGPTRFNNTVDVIATDNLGGFYGEVQYSPGGVAGSSNANSAQAIGGGYAAGPFSAKLTYQSSYDLTAADNTKNLLLGGTYDFGVAKAHLGYGTNRNEATLDTRDWLIGVTVPFGSHTFLASYINKADRIHAQSNANMLSLAYTYTLSKRTNFYTSVARLANDSAAAYGVAVAGTTDTTLNFGIRHKF